MDQLLSDAALSAAIAALTNTAVLLKGSASPLRDEWLVLLRRARETTNQGNCLVRIPANVEHERLLGGLDLSATLGAGKPIYLDGLLNTDQAQIICLAMAERWETGSTMLIAQAMDSGSMRHAVVVAQDEAQVNDDLQISSALNHRMGLFVPLHQLEQLPGIAWQLMKDPSSVFVQALDWSDRLEYACKQWRHVTTADALTQTICAAAAALGVDSMRAMIATAQAAKVIAAMDFRDHVSTADMATAVRLGLVWRATQIPPTQAAQEPSDDKENDDQISDDSDNNQRNQTPNDHQPHDEPLTESPNLSKDQIQALQETILEAALSSLPHDVLASLVAAAKSVQTKSQAGTSGAKLRASTHGRKRGSFRKKPSAAARLDVLQTLRSAAPWQRLRATDCALGKERQVHIRKQDFRYARVDQQTRSTMIFIVDASGSSALNRLSEAKGAIEILLAQCYVRRDQVCMISFRGTQAQISLPVTRSLARAKRSLNGLPGGGGTPIALGLDLGLTVAKQCQQRGETAFIIMLTDGKANVTRAGTGGRSIAHTEALAAARAISLQGVQSLLLDTSPQANPLAYELATQLRANYIALPYAGASKMAATVAASLKPT